MPDVPALVALAEAGDFAPLVALARDGTDGQKEQAAEGLRRLAVNADNRVAIAKAGGIAPLVALARDGTGGGTDWQKQFAAQHAAQALETLGCKKSMFGWKIPKTLRA